MIFSAFVNYNNVIREGTFLYCSVSRKGFTKINRSVGSVLEFQQNEPQNQQKIVTPVNNKVAAISKMMKITSSWRVNF